MKRNEYQKLLQRYHELKREEENLKNNEVLFQCEITLDSGNLIHPGYTDAYYRNGTEKHEILEQLLDDSFPAENTELQSITDIVSRICSFSKWGLYFFCVEPANRDFTEFLMLRPLSCYEAKADYFKSLDSKKLCAEDKLPFLFDWMRTSFRYKDEYELRKAVRNYCFYGEKYLGLSTHCDV